MQSSLTLSYMPRKPLPVEEKRAPLAARVLPSLLERLQALADADRRSLSFMVEEAVREFVDRHEGKQGRKPSK